MCDYTMDPSGDVVLTLQCPDEPFAPYPDVSSRFDQTTANVTNSAGSSVNDSAGSDDAIKKELEQKSAGGRATPATSIESSKTEEIEQTRKLVTFRVSSRHLILASHVFKSMLTGGWKEGQPTINGEYQLTAEGWNVDAMVVFLDALHGRYLKIPETVTLELLAKIAVIVDYYATHEAMHFLYPLWMKHLKATTPLHKAFHHPRELALWICITWVFSDEPNIVTLVRAAVEHNATGFWAGGLPIPGAVINRINDRRKEIVVEIHTNLQGLMKDLTQGREGCDVACRTMQLGVLYQTMSNTGLLGYVRGAFPPFVRVSEIVEKIKAIECPEWYGRGDIMPHKCQSAKSGNISSPVATTVTPPCSLFGSPQPTTAAGTLFGSSSTSTGTPFGSSSTPFGSSSTPFGSSSKTTAANAASKTNDNVHAISTRTASLLNKVRRIISTGTESDFSFKSFGR